MKVDKNMVGCRVLFTLSEDMLDYSFSVKPREGIIKEFSPDGNYVRIFQLNPEREEQWHLASDVEILSVLERPEAEGEGCL